MNHDSKRGLKAILPDNSTAKPKNEVIEATEAIHQVATILESVPERQFKNIMNAVIAIRRTAHDETVEEMGEQLRDLHKRNDQKKRRGFWRWK